MSQCYSPQFQWNQSWTSSKTIYKRTTSFHKEQNSPHSTSQNCWGSASTAPTSCSKVSIMNRLKVQPWDPKLALQWPTYTCNPLKTRHSQNASRLCKRFVDNMFIIHCTKHKDNFLQHINSIDRAIRFTVEDTRPDASMPFLDILVIPQHNGTFITRVYRKPTHTDQYLQWDSQHWCKIQ